MTVEVGVVRDCAADPDDKDMLNALEGSEKPCRRAAGRYECRIPRVTRGRCHRQLRRHHSVAPQVAEGVHVSLA